MNYFKRNLNCDIYQHLYQTGDKLKGYKIKKQSERNTEISNNSKKIFTTQVTENIFNKMTNNAYRRIFRIFNNDKSKSISYNHMIKTKLPDAVAIVLTPIILQAKVNLIVYDEEMFVDQCEILFQVYLYII